MKTFEVGQLITHKNYPSFKGRVEGRKNEKSVNVKVIAGWRGPKIPTWPVSLPIEKLLEVKDETQ